MACNAASRRCASLIVEAIPAYNSNHAEGRDNGYLVTIGEKRIFMSGDTGVIVDVDLGASEASFIALRSELDCVRVNDDKQATYASTRPGLCHACGHDAHSTMAVASAVVVHELASALRKHHDFRHNLRYIFQPAEEAATGARSFAGGLCTSPAARCSGPV